MNTTSILVAIPVLVLLNIIFARLVRKSYEKNYAKHIEFDLPTGKNADPTLNFLVWGIILFIVLFFTMSQGIEEDFHLFFGLSGFAIAVLAGSLIESIGSLLFYTFVKKNPHEITGKAHLKQRATIAISSLALLKYAALLFVVYLFVPSSFILGSALGLITLSITSYTAKKANPKY